MASNLALTYDFYNDSSIYGVYHNRYLTLQGNNFPLLSVDYIDVDVSYGGELTNLKLYTDSDKKAYLDVHKIIENQFASDANDVITDFIPYSIRARLYWDNGSSSFNQLYDEYALNGVKQGYDNYIFNEETASELSAYNNYPKFLSEQKENYLYWDTTLYDEIGESEINEMDIYFIGNQIPTNLVEWDSSSYVLIPPTGLYPDVNLGGDAAITFSIYINRDLKTEPFDDYSGGTGLFVFSDITTTPNTRLGCVISDTNLWAIGYDEVGSAYWYSGIDVSNLSYQTLNVEFKKDASGLTNFIINGVDVSSGAVSPSVYVPGYGLQIGRVNNTYLSDIYLWDIELFKNDVSIHKYNGYPNGDTNAGWVDQIGSKDGSIMGGSLTTTDVKLPYTFNVISYTDDSSTLFKINSQDLTDIRKIGMNYKNINVLSNVITNDTKYYTIQEENGYSDLYTFTRREPNKLNDKYFRLAWINESGVMNYYNFDYNYQKTIDIDKTIFNSLNTSFDQRYKYFNVETEISYTISTGWISENDSKYLEGLWKSPSIKATAHYFKQEDYFNDFVDDKLIDNEYIILNVKSMDIKRRRNGLINYTVEFTIANKQINQKN